MSAKLGMNCKMFRSDAPLADLEQATVEAANWTEQTNVRDLTTDLETGEADITTRANDGWKATLATLKNGSVEFEMVWDTDDAGFTAMQQAWLNSTTIGLAFLDGPIDEAGNQGPIGNWSVTNFSRSEPLDGAVLVKVTVKPVLITWWTSSTF